MNWKCAIVVGAQWGDEGKGKIVDLLTEKTDIVVRSQGGNNAGHTINVGTEKYVLHLLPSGILRPNVVCVIGNGVVLDAQGLAQEITGLRERSIAVSPSNLLISDAAHLVMPWHRRRDAQREEMQGSRSIGTTRRGIGPTYSDKALRSGIRAGDLLDWPSFLEKLRPAAEENARQLGCRADELFDEAKAAAEQALEILRPHITNTVVWLHNAQKIDKKILFEGAQGTFLDIDHGTYPFVTSSNTTAGGACTGSGIPPTAIDYVLGVLKAYSTRVGGGPFPSESAVLSQHLHSLGREFGATTGRARRCGWLDCVMLRHAAALNGFSEFAVTNLDGLDAFEEIEVCVGYELRGHRLTYPPTRAEDWAECQPIYQTLRGWNRPTSEARQWSDLPPEAQDYIRFLEQEIGVKCALVSVGPAREQTLLPETA